MTEACIICMENDRELKKCSRCSGHVCFYCFLTIQNNLCPQCRLPDAFEWTSVELVEPIFDIDIRDYIRIPTTDEEYDAGVYSLFGPRRLVTVKEINKSFGKFIENMHDNEFLEVNLINTISVPYLVNYNIYTPFNNSRNDFIYGEQLNITVHRHVDIKYEYNLLSKTGRIRNNHSFNILAFTAFCRQCHAIVGRWDHLPEETEIKQAKANHEPTSLHQIYQSVTKSHKF